MKRLWIVTCALLCVSTAAEAAGPTGIAFVYAPEMGSGVCTGGTPEKAFACAREKCIREGGNMPACKRIAWCFPARWSVDVFLQNADGFHWRVQLRTRLARDRRQSGRSPMRPQDASLPA